MEPHPHHWRALQWLEGLSGAVQWPMPRPKVSKPWHAWLGLRLGLGLGSEGVEALALLRLIVIRVRQTLTLTLTLTLARLPLVVVVGHEQADRGGGEESLALEDAPTRKHA